MRHPNEKGHGGQKIIDERHRQNWYENMLPYHGVDNIVGGLDAGAQPLQLLRGEDDPPLV